MKKDQYLPHDVTAADNIRIARLIHTEGAEGYGIYWMLIEHLRKQDLYKSSLDYIEILARKVNIGVEKIKRIINDFKLFRTENGNFFSPGLCERMESLDEKREKQAAGGRKGAARRYRKPDNDRLPITVKESKAEESKEKESDVIRDDFRVNTAGAAGIQSWEKCVDALARDESWQEIIAMRSPLRTDFIKRLPEILILFKQHIISRGKEKNVLTESDAKSYFSNFITPESYTGKRLYTRLAQTKLQDPYRFEDISPDGKRSYYGLPIPADAPPRPNANAHWSGEGWD